MPIYPYKCPACGQTTERLVKIEDRDKQVCDCTNFLTRELTSPLPPIFNGIAATCSMTPTRMPDTTLTTNPR